MHINELEGRRRSADLRVRSRSAARPFETGGCLDVDSHVTRQESPVLRTVIADEDAAALLVQEALQLIGKVEVVGIAGNGMECLELCERHDLDALFLEIRLPGLSGIEVAERMSQLDHPPLIAFITKVDEYAVRAFELNAVDYIIKMNDLPAMVERISRTVERMQAALARNPSDPDELRAMIARLARQQAHPLQRMLPVRDAKEGTIRLLDPLEVIFITRRQRRTMLVTRQYAYPAYYTIDSLDERLDGEGFFRANPGTLINTRYIEHLLPNGDGSYDVFLKSDLSEGAEAYHTPVTLSRSRARQLLRMLHI